MSNEKQISKPHGDDVFVKDFRKKDRSSTVNRELQGFKAFSKLIAEREKGSIDRGRT